MTDDIADKPHAKRSPSSTKRRELCPGSVVLEAAIGGRNASRYAAEGTVAHQVLELSILENRDAEAYVGRKFKADGYSFTVDMEMADKVNECLAFINLYLDPSLGDLLMAETTVPVGFISGEADAEGTSDIIGVTANGTHLVILDLKYGKGVTVFATDEYGKVNKQLAYYALGSLELMSVSYPGIEVVTLGIMQPRTNNFDTVTLTVDELREVEAELRAIEAQCDVAELFSAEHLAGLGMLNPSREGCQFCKAKNTCPARQGEYNGGPSGNADDADFEDLSV